MLHASCNNWACRPGSHLIGHVLFGVVASCAALCGRGCARRTAQRSREPGTRTSAQQIPTLTRCSDIRMAASPSTSVSHSSGKTSAAMASRTSRARSFETLHLDIVAGVFIRARPSRLARARPAWVPLIKHPTGEATGRTNISTRRPIRTQEILHEHASLYEIQ